MAAEKLHRSSGGLAALLKSISAAVGEGAQIVFESFFSPRFSPLVRFITARLWQICYRLQVVGASGCHTICRLRGWADDAQVKVFVIHVGVGGRVKSQEARGEDRQQLMGSLSFCVYCRGQSGPWGPALELPRGDYLHYSHNTNLISSWNVRAPSQPVIRGPQRLTETCGKVLERGKERLESNETVTSLTGRRDLKLV